MTVGGNKLIEESYSYLDGANETTTDMISTVVTSIGDIDSCESYVYDDECSDYSGGVVDLNCGYNVGIDHAFPAKGSYRDVTKSTSFTFSNGFNYGSGFDYYSNPLRLFGW